MISARSLQVIPRRERVEDNALAEYERGGIDYDSFVTKFTDPKTKDLAIALALRDLSATLANHVISQEDFIKTLLERFARIELGHRDDIKTLRESDIKSLRDEMKDVSARVLVIEKKHDSERAVHESDAARVIWLNRVFGGVIGSGIIAGLYWLQAWLGGRPPSH